MSAVAAGDEELSCIVTIHGPHSSAVHTREAVVGEQDRTDLHVLSGYSRPRLLRQTRSPSPPTERRSSPCPTPREAPRVHHRLTIAVEPRATRHTLSSPIDALHLSFAETKALVLVELAERVL